MKLQARNLIKKEALAQVFPCEFCKMFNNTFLRNSSGRLLLKLEGKLFLANPESFPFQHLLLYKSMKYSFVEWIF